MSLPSQPLISPPRPTPASWSVSKSCPVLSFLLVASPACILSLPSPSPSVHTPRSRQADLLKSKSDHVAPRLWPSGRGPIPGQAFAAPACPTPLRVLPSAHPARELCGTRLLSPRASHFASAPQTPPHTLADPSVFGRALHGPSLRGTSWLYCTHVSPTSLPLWTASTEGTASWVAPQNPAQFLARPLPSCVTSGKSLTSLITTSVKWGDKFAYPRDIQEN